ncbi:hypothetical protein FIBSPDRAFT_897491 [Athelia psychrophila]|uniref:Uncharacterized protein n=1 Tax=Athelia psychrophila TaxID=1759441 RepID=A0A166C707_9AGAM|nr:hypothetical protein FIBSPDRAFT_897491 [Fibularhizoctonia sp. CBS 109695]
MAATLDATADSLKEFPIAQIKRETEYITELVISAKHGSTITPAIFACAIKGWRKFVLPYTHYFDSSGTLCDPLLHYVSLLLKFMASALNINDPQQVASASSQIANVWPSIWIWLRTLHSHSQRSHPDPNQEESHISPKNLYNVVVVSAHPTLYTGKSNAGNDGHDGVYVDRSISGTNGFQGPFFTSPLSSGAPSNTLPYIMDRCDDGADGVVKILFCRIKCNVKQAKTDWTGLQNDLQLIQDHLKTCDDTKILRQVLLSHTAVIFVLVDVLSRLANKAQTTVDVTIDLSHPLIIISQYRNIRSYDCIFQLANTTFVALITQLSRTRGLGLDANVVYLTREILVEGARFSIYRTLLGAMGRNIALALPEGEVAYRKRSGQYPLVQTAVILKYGSTLCGNVFWPSGGTYMRNVHSEPVVNTLTSPFDPPDMAIINVARKSILLLNYANAGEGRMRVEVIYLSEFDTSTFACLYGNRFQIGYRVCHRIRQYGISAIGEGTRFWAQMVECMACGMGTCTLAFSECLLFVISVMIVIPR